jgi:ketosteroid isomerase-like protein
MLTMQIPSRARYFFFTCCLLFAAGTRAEEQKPGDAVRAMVDAERRFYQTGQEHGTRAAFLTFLADDSIVFRPGPLNGREVWTKRAENGLDLIWEPTFAVMARSGDFGYTTGPAKWKASKTETKLLGYGTFVSIWKKQPDGTWKVALDAGTETPEPTGKSESLRMVSSDKPPKAKPDPDSARKAFEQAQKKFAEAAKADSGRAALAVAADDIRVYRDAHFPAVGLASAGGLLTAQGRKLLLETLGGDMSHSADLAYTYGKYSSAGEGNEKGHYFQIWQRDDAGHWKLVLDWQQALPEK